MMHIDTGKQRPYNTKAGGAVILLLAFLIFVAIFLLPIVKAEIHARRISKDAKRLRWPK